MTRIMWMPAVAALALLTFVGGSGQSAAAQQQETRAVERGWLGVGVSCRPHCSRQETDDGVVVWSFDRPPAVGAIAPGSPAEEAGLQAGDTIVAIDGLDVTTEAGGRQFGMVRVGAEVAILVRRDGAERTVRVRAVSYDSVAGRGEERLAVGSADWESMRAQVRALYEQQRALQRELREVEILRDRAESQPASRDRLDSMRQRMTWLQQQLRRHADSLAMRVLYMRAVSPEDPIVMGCLQPGADPQRAGPGSRTPPIAVAPYSNAFAGARFEEMTDELAGYFPGADSGLLVLQVVEGTPADAAGIRRGDVVVEANGVAVETVADLRQALCEAGQAEVVLVRKGARQKIMIAPR